MAAPAAEPRPPCRLYLLTPPVLPDLAAFARQLSEVIAAGDVACLQLRLKGADDARVLEAARHLFPAAQEAGVACLLNDRPDLVAACGADGAHVGRSDMPVRAARAIMGPERIVGATCHASRHLAMEAVEDGADYVAFGAFFDSATKTPPERADPDILSWWQELMEAPCVAIGGIHPGNAAALMRAGADFVAASSGIWAWPDGPAAAARALRQAALDAAGSA